MSCAFGITNLAEADTATLTVSGSIPLAPASKLLTPHVGDKWQINADTGYIDLDLGSNVSFDTIMLDGVTGDPDFLAQASTASAGDDNVFGSGTLSGTPNFDPDYGLFVYLRSTPVSARYVRLTLTDTGVASIAAGRFGVFLRDVPAVNFATPWSIAAIRGSQYSYGPHGQTFVDLRRGHWRQGVRFDALSEANRTGFLRTLGVAAVNDGHKDFLFIADTDSANLSMDSLWCYADGDLVLTQDQYVVPAIFSVEFPLRQRR